MELVKNIFFNTDKLVENSNIKISYTGKFFQENSVFEIEKNQNALLVLEDEPVSLGSARKLRKSYLWSKKIRLAVYKIITYFPKIISGNYKRKLSEN